MFSLCSHCCCLRAVRTLLHSPLKDKGRNHMCVQNWIHYHQTLNALSRWYRHVQALQIAPAWRQSKVLFPLCSKHSISMVLEWWYFSSVDCMCLICKYKKILNTCLLFWKCFKILFLTTVRSTWHTVCCMRSRANDTWFPSDCILYP